MRPTGAILRRGSKRWMRSGVLKQTLREQPPQKRQKRNNADCVPPILLTHDDHLLHNNSDSVSWRSGDRLQLGMNDFLRRNTQTVAGPRGSCAWTKPLPA